MTPLPESLGASPGWGVDERTDAGCPRVPRVRDERGTLAGSFQLARVLRRSCLDMLAIKMRKSKILRLAPIEVEGHTQRASTSGFSESVANSCWQKSNCSRKNLVFSVRCQKRSLARKITKNLTELVAVFFKCVGFGKVFVETEASHPQAGQTHIDLLEN